MPDYKFKSEVIKTGVYKVVNIIDRNDFIKKRDGIVIDKDNDDVLFDLTLQYGGKFIKECRRINQANYKRIDRLKNRISLYLNKGQCIFATLTFDDYVLNNTSVETRRKYVSRYLKSISDYYIANIDYGDKTEREHYHALIVIDYISVKWNYGFTWFEKIHNLNSDSLGRYISKLTNHAIKESTKRCCYIYSRKG